MHLTLNKKGLEVLRQKTPSELAKMSDDEFLSLLGDQLDPQARARIKNLFQDAELKKGKVSSLIYNGDIVDGSPKAGVPGDIRSKLEGEFIRRLNGKYGLDKSKVFIATGNHDSVRAQDGLYTMQDKPVASPQIGQTTLVVEKGRVVRAFAPDGKTEIVPTDKGRVVFDSAIDQNRQTVLKEFGQVATSDQGKFSVVDVPNYGKVAIIHDPGVIYKASAAPNADGVLLGDLTRKPGAVSGDKPFLVPEGVRAVVTGDRHASGSFMAENLQDNKPVVFGFFGTIGGVKPAGVAPTVSYFRQPRTEKIDPYSLEGQVNKEFYQVDLDTFVPKKGAPVIVEPAKDIKPVSREEILKAYQVDP